MDYTTKNIEMDNVASKNVLPSQRPPLQVLNINEILADLNYGSDDFNSDNTFANPEYRINELDKILTNTSENLRQKEGDSSIRDISGLTLTLPTKNTNTDIVIYNKYTEGEYGTDILKKLPSIVHTKERSMSMKIASGAGTCGFLLGGLGLCFGIVPGVIGAGVGIGVGASVASVIYYVKEKTTSTKFKAVNFTS
jgi:hypothetical protein